VLSAMISISVSPMDGEGQIHLQHPYWCVFLSYYFYFIFVCVDAVFILNADAVLKSGCNCTCSVCYDFNL